MRGPSTPRFHVRPPASPARTARIAAVATGVWLAALAPLAASVQDGIETESITEQGTLDPFSVSERELQEIFEAAERLFRSPEQPDSVALFDRLIARLESDHARRPLAPELMEMLIQSRSHRAEAHFNLGATEKAVADLERILELRPSWRVDPDLVSPKLVDLVERRRREQVGELLVLVDPVDANVALDGRPIDSVGQPTAVLAGERRLTITRPGYAPVEEQVEVRADRSTTADHTLERLSIVARIVVSPAGVTVLVNGKPAQVAERRQLAEDGTEEDLAIEGLPPGSHVFELRLPEYRPYRLGFEAYELDDYRLKPAALERMQGEVRLVDLPADAAVAFDGRSASPLRTGEDGAAFTLDPGDYLVEVSLPGVGGFRERVSLGDQEVVSLEVRLRPTLAFLGVLGSDRLAASDLATRLASRLGRLSEWLWSDHSIEAPAVLDAAGLDADELRRVAALASRRAAPDWTPIQASFDERFGSSLYLLAVLGDDLYATSADLWLWSPAPWPAAPSIRTVPIQGGEQVLEQLAAAFDADVVPRHPRFGARFIESDGLVTSHLVAGGPAAAAGLAPGDRVVALSGRPISSLRELLDGARTLAGGEALLRIDGQPGPREIRLPVTLEPGVFMLSDAALVDQVAAARLSLERRRPESAVPGWLLELNQAAIYLRAMAYAEAVPLLRTIQAPDGAGLSAAMVEYWLGSALLSLDPQTYGAAAQAAFQRALEHEAARLYHDDGPLLAPRARARLAELERRRGLSSP